MNEKILVVDDDFGTLKLIETVLRKNDYIPCCFSSSLDALKSFEVTEYDLIISDFFMPEMNGEVFLDNVRQKDKYIPFIILTVNNDIQNATNLLKHGADDYISKPVVKEELIFRINKNIEEKKNKKILDRIEKEKEILNLESKRMVNWKLLYASKDVKQTDQVINLFTRTLNQGGGFVWLDILKSSTEKIDDEHYKINSSLVDLI
ncbi:MAG TPA: response regulator, partial [Spirochaetota bacterium]|nr:response regulator [Spirochaetota bacterium]